MRFKVRWWSRPSTGSYDPPLSPADVELTNDSIQRSLLRVTPYGGTPIAASLDDLYYFFDRDINLQPERESGSRPYVILITDGYPDDDYRSFGCDCAKTGECAASARCVEDALPVSDA